MEKLVFLYVDSPLPVLYSARIRLDESQRDILKQALNEFRLRHIPEQPSAPVMPGSTISVVTQQKVGSNVYQEHGLSDLIVSDIIRTRDTVPLTIILKLQKMLSVQVIDRKELEKWFQGYLDYLYQ